MQLTTGIAVIKTINFDMNNFLSTLTIALKKTKTKMLLQSTVTYYMKDFD
jgi:hypothetical protein